MFRKLFGPRHTFNDALRLLETGLRSGDITLRDDSRSDSLRSLDIEAKCGDHLERISLLVELLASSGGHVVVHLAGHGGVGNSRPFAHALALKELIELASSQPHIVVLPGCSGELTTSSPFTRGLVAKLQEVDPGLRIYKPNVSIGWDPGDDALVVIQQPMVGVFAEGIALWAGEQSEKMVLVNLKRKGTSRLLRIASANDARKLSAMLVTEN
jgi:hypothetical protein